MRLMLHIISLQVAALLLMQSPVVHAEETELTAQQLINRMSQAAHELNYDGIFIYRSGRQMDTLRLIHKSGEQGEFERLISLTGNAREVIRDNESVTCIFPEDKAVMVERSRADKFLSAKLPEPIEQIAAYYEFIIAGQDRIAGRDAWVVSIMPRDSYRYGYQYWIDRENHLLLKSELKNNSGYTLEQIMFTQLSVLEDIPDELLKPTINGSGYTWYNNSDTATSQSGENGSGSWQISWTPGGFSMSHHETRAQMAGSTNVEHIIYTDGLAMVSIFIEKQQGEPTAQFIPGPSKMGAVNTFARFANGYQVTAVGEVPPITVKNMANAIVADH